MSALLENPIFKLYLTLIGWVLLGYILGRRLPKNTTSLLGGLLFWVGVPISVVAFMRRTDISAYILVSPISAWVAIIVGAAFAWVWIELGISDERIDSFASGVNYLSGSDLNSDEVDLEGDTKQRMSSWTKPTQGSFLLSMMVGNTAYMGYPVVLSVVGPEYFIWAVLYNTLGTSIGVYGVGTVLAAKFGQRVHGHESLWKIVMRNPALWSFFIGFGVKNVPLPATAESLLQGSAWAVVTMSLILIGIQLSQLPALRRLGQASTCLAIKMLLVPLVVGTALIFFLDQSRAAGRLAIVLQMGMPPSFNTVLLAEAYGLDRELAVTTIAFGSVALLFTIPLWLYLFPKV